MSPASVDGVESAGRGGPTRLRSAPADGAYLNTPNSGGNVYVIAGGAPLYLADCTGIGGCNSLVGVSQYTSWHLHGVRSAITRLDPPSFGKSRVTRLAAVLPRCIDRCAMAR